ncbi:MAG: site-specific DNA-methyltransferase [Candidatus Izemoplasmatales bacterium]|nr:site-specific DNA-methyltransferase [Candidatus Izemoplasmatales bacterium]
MLKDEINSIGFFIDWSENMPTLDWIGKEKVVNHHQVVPYRVLNERYTFNASSSNNMIINGDNLLALKSLLPEYEGKVDIVYIDPPYNTGIKEGQWVYSDNVDDPRIRKWLGEVVGAEGDDLSRHDKWLCMMYPRLKLLQKLLSKNGFIFISIDENELYNLKLIADEIFGANNFVGQYMWYKSATPPNLSYKVKRNLEYVVCYQKEQNSVKFQGVQKSSPSNDPMTKPQNSIKELRFLPGVIKFPFKSKIIAKGVYGTKKFPNELLDDLIIEDGTNKNEVTFKNKFIWIQETLDKNIKDGVDFFCSKNLVLSYKRKKYDREVPPSLIDDSVGVSTTEEAGKDLSKIFEGKKVFDYPKPVSLIKYILQFTNNKKAIILDSFAGSGTTAHAVLELNKQDGGSREFILVELMDYAENVTAQRVKKVISGYEDILGIDGDFTFYDLGEKMFLDNGDINEGVDIEKIREYIYFMETKEKIVRDERNPYYLGSKDLTDYYFYYEIDSVTNLNYDFLSTLIRKNEIYIIYADKCTISDADLERYGIVFKKIPRDISRL